MATVSDTFNRADTSQGTLGSTDTGNLSWQNATQWNISTNAANNTQSSDIAWCVIPNSDAEVGIETGVGATLGNGVGAAFWVADSSNYWISYVYGERYQSGTTCVGGYYSCTSCTGCGGGNINPTVYTTGQSNSFVSNVACGCTDTTHGACSCSANGVASRASGTVAETQRVCGTANCAQPSGNNAQTCESDVVENATNYNPITGGNQAGGNVAGTPCTGYASSTTNGKNAGNPKFVKNGSTKSGGSVFSPAGTNAGNPITSPGGCANYKTNYNAITYNAISGGNYASGGNSKTVYSCGSGNSYVGTCATDACTPVSGGSYSCGNTTCGSANTVCTSCGTTGVESTITCTCTASGGNTNACSTCVPTSGVDCYDACLSTVPAYQYRYYLKVDRIASGSRTNHYVSAALYDSTSSTETWGSIKVVTAGGSYTATVYTDAAWTTSAATSGSQASGQTDYLSSVGHGMGVAPLGDQSPGETNQIDFWYTTYVSSGDSVGVIVG